MSPARPHHPVIMNRLLAEHWHRRKEVRSIVLVVVCLMYTTFVHIRPAQRNVNHYRHTGTTFLRSQNSSKNRFVVAGSAWALHLYSPLPVDYLTDTKWTKLQIRQNIHRT
jgi:hypothetical protein